MIYVTSDLHGFSLGKFKEFLDGIGFGDEDFLYVLGDVIDRGTDGIKILRWLMSKNNAQLIMGNHEAMLLACDFLFDEITEQSISDLTGTKLDMYLTWVSNGGQPTIDALSAMRKSEIKYLLEFLRDIPLYEGISVGDRDFILVHSGLGNFREDKKLSQYSEDDLLWTRPAIDVKYYDGITVIFGHTPTLVYGDEYKGKPIITDSFINIDVGVAAGLNPMLLRLDDMKEFYYEEKENENE